ncbi:MAG: PEP-CTERM sorting domain-containing protein [Phycisphaerales bacterium]|nr:MAG: PEP-CTERM sorting domain-containing protein [Phycisphaerales bacterium]
MKYLGVCALVMLMAVPVMATPTLTVSMGIRETDQVGAIGDSMPNAGGAIEWLNKDEYTLVLDGTWQTFSFDFSSMAAFTGDGAVSADRGLLEHIRFLSTGYTHTQTVWVDNVSCTYDPAGLPPPATWSTSFDDVSYTDGQEVMFQEPTFSGSTSGYIVTGATSGFDSSVSADANGGSVKAEWQFIDGSTTNWLRYTAYSTGQPEANPLLAEPNGPAGAYTSSVITFSLMGVPEPASLSLLAVGGLALLRRRR